MVKRMDFSHNSDQLHPSEDTNKVAKLERRRDRLSELPDSLTLKILSLLEMKDVVRTTILSKNWKDRWTTVPCLHFWNEKPVFIEGALAKWNGAKIHKFLLAFWRDHPRDFLDSSWLLLPIEKQVEDLYICLNNIYPEYCAPQRLYSCSSITRLILIDCSLKIEENVNVQWNQLKYLRIEGKDCSSEDALNRILSGAPMLEELLLLGLNILKNIDIQSTSLKMLQISIYRVGDFGGNPLILEIRAPNLLVLEISGLGHTRCLLNVPSLTNAALGFDFRHYGRTALVEDMSRQAFLSLSHVQNLTLNERAIKFLVDEMKKDNYVFFPKLVMLIVKCDYLFGVRFESLAPKSIFPRPSLLQLKTIVITWDVRDDSIFALVEFLLENAPALEKMVLRLRQHELHAEDFLVALENVLSMRRSSPYARVIISKD